MLILIVKYVSFTKTLLLIIIIWVVPGDWSVIYKSMLVEEKKCCIDIVAGTNNLR